jgi:aminopeptidase N
MAAPHGAIPGGALRQLLSAGEPLPGINAAYQARDAVQILEKGLTAYPYDEFDVIACPLPNRAAGMEYPGIVAINSFFYDPANGDQGLGANLVLEIILAHEAAHQWFYNLVGNDAVEEPWLDESFAQHFTWYYFEGKYGPGGGDLQYTGFENRWNRTERSTKALDLAAYEYDNREYGSLIYGAAPLFLHDLMLEVGEDEFYAFVTDYLSTLAWGTATTESFEQILARHFPEVGPRLFREWVKGERS